MPHVSCLFKKGVETFINIRLIKRQNPMECIVHFGKSFTQPIPKIINIEAIELIKTINKQDVTILMVEHVMRVIMGLCGRVIVLNHGEKICEGDPKTVVCDENVVKVYLGKRFTFGEQQ